MKGSNLGELEELVLLTVGALFGKAYGVTIQEELKKRADRSITLPTVHVVLIRLVEKGFLESRFDGATPERGGRRKHLFQVTKSGYKVLRRAQEIRKELWERIPHTAYGIQSC